MAKNVMTTSGFELLNSKCYNLGVKAKQKELSLKLTKLKKLFDFKTVLLTKTDKLSVAKYYKANKLSYSLFHDKGFIHMGISRNGRYKKDDLFEQAKIIEKYISRETKNILELATGRGANSIYLAKKYPNIKFVGIDLPNGQLDYVNKSRKDIVNFVPTEGDFHDLSKYSINTFDIVFIVEALCHSANKETVVKEVKRILKRKGFFVIIDGFIAKEYNELSLDEQLAKKLVEKGMTVAEFASYKEFCKLLTKNGFKIIFEEDDSYAILPSLAKFEKLAGILLSFPSFISKLLVRSLPNEFTYNAISAYLMPTLVKKGTSSYMAIVTQK